MKNQMGSSGLGASPFAALSLTALSLTGLMLAGVGCTLEEVDSDAIRTRGMYAEMLAIAPGNGTTLVRVNLTVGGSSGTRVQLSGSDALVAESGGAVEGLSRAGRGRYEQTLQSDSSEEIVVRLERGDEDDTVQGSAVLPDPFAMQLETDGAAGVDRASNVIVSWQDASADASAQLKWSVDGDCIWSDSGVTPDDGVLTLTADRVRVRATQRGKECAVRLTLDRERAGSIDPTFVPGSSFRAIQRRAVSFVSTPTAAELAGPAAAASAAEDESEADED
ncbi:MAG: hypothetical protein RL033_1159 [Pseudomonadota bacterium]